MNLSCVFTFTNVIILLLHLQPSFSLYRFHDLNSWRNNRIQLQKPTFSNQPQPVFPQKSYMTSKPPTYDLENQATINILKNLKFNKFNRAGVPKRYINVYRNGMLFNFVYVIVQDSIYFMVCIILVVQFNRLTQTCHCVSHTPLLSLFRTSSFSWLPFPVLVLRTSLPLKIQPQSCEGAHHKVKTNKLE